MIRHVGIKLALVTFSCIWVAFAQPVIAQSSGILVVDLERAYKISKFGKALRDTFNIENKSFNQENSIILNDLKEEEIKLTEDRAILSPEDFSVAAKSFDKKVQKIRKARLDQIGVVEENFKRLKPFFFRRIDRFFDVIMKEFDATAILEKNSVVRSDQAIDITDLLIERVDQEFLANGVKTETDAEN